MEPDFQVQPLEYASAPPIAPDEPAPFWRRGGFYAAGSISLVIIFFFTYLALRNGNDFSSQSVTMTISGPQEITGGDRVDYTINYQNNSGVDLRNASLAITLPVGALPIASGAVDQFTSKNIELGDIPPGAQGSQALSAFILGQQGDVKKTRAVLTYRPAGLASDFSASAELSLNISSTIVPLTVTAPPKVLSGQKFSYTIDYKNQSPSEIRNLLIRLELPDDFQASKFLPAVSDPTGIVDLGYGEKIWFIPALAVGDSSRIIIEGSLQGNSGTRVARVRLQHQVTIDENTIFVDLEKTQAESLITPALLSIQTKVGGQDNYVASPGEVLRYTVTIQNQSDFAISDLKVSVGLLGSLFDPSSLEGDGVFDGHSSTINWDAATVPGLRALGAGQSTELAFRIKVKDVQSIPKDSVLITKAHVETDNVPANISADLLSADNVLTVNFGANPQLTQLVLVNNTLIGVSPIFPPKVDQTSIFTVYWKVVNPLHTLSPAAITAAVPPGVTWLEKFSVANSSTHPVFDASSRTITWNLGPLPAGVGTKEPAAEAYFQISVTPSANQVGQNLTLLADIVFDGFDSVTQKGERSTYDDLHSSEVSDSSQDGIVQP